LSKEKRTKVIGAFRNGSCPCLIVTNVAARDVNVPDAEYIINYTYPPFFTVYDQLHVGNLIDSLKKVNKHVPEALINLFGATGM
jgi:ATP-dependent RNA helicase DBP3